MRNLFSSSRKTSQTQKQKRRQLRIESLEHRQLLNVDWRNPVDHLDVSGDSLITPIDALRVINELNRSGSHDLPATPGEFGFLLNTNGDSIVSPIDALLVINYLNVEGSGRRTLKEDSGFSSREEIQVTLGANAGTRLYRVQIDANFEAASSNSLLADTFSVYLVHPLDRTNTLVDRGTQGTSIFSLDKTGADYASGVVRWDGSILEMDFSSVKDFDTGILVFQLLNGGGSNLSEVAITPLSNEVQADLAPSELLRARDVIYPSGNATDLSAMTLDTGIQVEMSNLRYDDSSRLLKANISLHNQSNPAGRDIAVVFDALPSDVTLLNASGLDPQGRPYINLRNAIRNGGLGNDQRSELVELRLQNPRNQLFSLTPRVYVGQPNRPPQIPVLSNRSLKPGDQLEFSIGASDPDSDPVFYSVQVASNNLSFPRGELNASTGVLRFAPSPADIGVHQVTVSASDGALNSSRTFTLEVSQDTVNSTRVSGQVLDVDGSPISGLKVEIGSVQSLTSSDGIFELDLGTGPVPTSTLRIRGEEFVDPTRPNVHYPFIAEKLPFLFGRELYSGFDNVLERPIYLPKLNPGSPVNPTQNTTIESEVRSGFAPVTVTIAAGSLLTQQGTPFTGNLSITEVPVERTPAALPKTLVPIFS